MDTVILMDVARISLSILDCYSLTMIICTLAPLERCLLMTSFRKMISVSFMVTSSSVLWEWR